MQASSNSTCASGDLAFRLSSRALVAGCIALTLTPICSYRWNQHSGDADLFLVVIGYAAAALAIWVGGRSKISSLDTRPLFRRLGLVLGALAAITPLLIGAFVVSPFLCSVAGAFVLLSLVKIGSGGTIVAKTARLALLLLAHGLILRDIVNSRNAVIPWSILSAQLFALTLIDGFPQTRDRGEWRRFLGVHGHEVAAMLLTLPFPFAVLLVATEG